MAGFASLRRTVGTTPRHAFVEFAMMHILMAGGVGANFEMERPDFILSAGGAHFIAIRARQRGAGARPRKNRLVVLCDQECGDVLIHNGSAIPAFVQLR